MIRDLRGDINTHRSMLINVSRFTEVQINLFHLVNAYLKDVQASTRQNGQLPSEEAINNNIYIRALYNTYKKYYSKLEFSWEEILKNLYKSIAGIIATTVNQKNNNSLNYEDYKMMD